MDEYRVQGFRSIVRILAVNDFEGTLLVIVGGRKHSMVYGIAFKMKIT